MAQQKKYVLFETIAIVDGQVQNLNYHQQRYQQGMKYLKEKQGIQLLNVVNLQDIIHLPSEYQQGVIRCRIDYDGLWYQVAFYPYQARKIHRFKMVEVDDIDYQYKFSNRTIFEQMMEQRGIADEIIIIQHGLITDCSIGNLLFLQQGRWFTPKQPLLEGTQRAKLLAERRILTRSIVKDDIYHYEKVMMINALNPFDEWRTVDICMENIF